jgi:hypothetical protein
MGDIEIAAYIEDDKRASTAFHHLAHDRPSNHGLSKSHLIRDQEPAKPIFLSQRL